MSTLYEMVFLKQALERLDWQADELASQHKDGVITEQLVVFMVSCHGCQCVAAGGWSRWFVYSIQGIHS